MVTVSLLMLLVIVGVGLLSLSILTVRNASRGAELAQAQANARLALMMAIGRLQSELGPDQRVNAPADLLMSGLDDSRARWVGVWDSWPAGLRERPEPSFRGWLVSGTPTRVGDLEYPGTAGEDLVVMMEGDKGPLAEVPRQALEGGGLAYWISDENAKARLGPPLDPDEEDLSSHFARYHSAPAGHRALPGLKDLERDDERIERPPTTGSVELIATGPSSPDEQRSYTVWAEGLLTDVRRGGFRKDLSLRLADPASGRNELSLYQSAGGRRGINFRELRAFHEVSSRLVYDRHSRYPHPDGGPLNNKVPLLVGAANEAAAATDPFFAYLRPVVVRASWHISAMTRSVDDNPRGDSALGVFIVLEPILTLWNPHDVTLVMQPQGHLTSKCWGLPYDLNVRVGNTAKNFHFNSIRKKQGDSIGMEIGQKSPVVMRPGEVLIYSRGRQATTPSERFASFEGKLGWSGTGGFALDTGIRAASSEQISVGMKRSSKRGARVWGLIEFLTYVGPLAGNRYWNGGLMIDRRHWEGELRATDFPDGLFTEVPQRTLGSAGRLLEKPEPLALFSYMARTEEQGLLDTRYLARLNPAAAGFDHQTADSNTMHSLPYEPVMQPLNGALDRGFDYFNGKGFFGASYMADLGQSYLVTHSVPREAPLSLGAYQHAHANGAEVWTFTGPGAGNFHDRILQPSINHAIGNSFAPPCIASDKVEGNFNSMAAVDHSWLANDALWDEWFVSSIADRTTAPHLKGDEGGTARTLFSRLAGEDDQPRLLPNRSYRYAGKDPAEDVKRLFDGKVPKEEAWLQLAALLRVHGAFNVNSTDWRAWLALFRSTSALRVPVAQPAGRDLEWEEAAHPVAALHIPADSRVETRDLANPASPAQWKGYRDLSDEELEDLAKAMVEEVRKRGPFLSLADFVNRRLDTGYELSSRGALQAALDNTVNSDLEAGPRSGGGGAGAVAFPEAEQGSQMTHVPGHVKQGDLLTTIGSRLTPRSDTFRIRAYGESRNAAGKVVATARCEAIVRRTAEWIEPGDELHLPLDELDSEINKRFGRRFEMVSFRWLPNAAS